MIIIIFALTVIFPILLRIGKKLDSDYAIVKGLYTTFFTTISLALLAWALMEGQWHPNIWSFFGYSLIPLVISYYTAYWDDLQHYRLNKTACPYSRKRSADSFDFDKE